MSRSIATVFQNYQTVCCVHVAKELLLDEGWTSKSPADGITFLSLLKCICSQEDASSCLGKGLSARQRSPNSGTDYSGRDHIPVEDCFWITRLVMKHSFSVSELQTVCSVHVANDPSQVVSVYYVRDSGVVSVEELDSQLPKHWTLCQQMGDSVILRLTEWAEGLYRAVKFAKMIIETSMPSQNLSGRSKVSLIHPDQILGELIPPQHFKHLRRVQLVGLDPAHSSLSP